MKKIIILVLLMILFGVGAGQCKIPQKINFQGRLATSGNLESGTYSIKANLYDINQNRIITNNDYVPIVIDNDGFFNSNIGLSGIFGQDLFNNNYSVLSAIKSPSGVIVDFDPQPLLSVPYALNADRLGGISSTSYVTKDASTGQIFGLTISSGISTAEADTKYVRKIGDQMGGNLIVDIASNPTQGMTNAIAAVGKTIAVAGTNQYSSAGYLAYKGASENAGLFGKSNGGYGLLALSEGNNYSGYFKGGKGVKIEGVLDVTNGINLLGGSITQNGYPFVAGAGMSTQDADSRYLKLSGGQINGPLRIVSTTSQSSLYSENSSSGYSGYFKGSAGVKIEGSLEVTRGISAETIKASRFIGNGSGITGLSSGITTTEADGKYVNVSGDAMTGRLMAKQRIDGPPNY